MKRLIIATIILAAIPWTIKAQSLDLAVQLEPEPTVEFRFANDSWLTKDKRDHLLGGIGTMALTSFIFETNTDNQVLELAAYNVGFWFVWELKDSVVPWEEYGWWGGDGFSTKDVIWSAAGVGIVAGVLFAIK